MTVGSTSTPPRWQAAPVTTHLPANATEERAGGWNFADIWEAHALRFPDAIAQVQGTNRSTWSEFDARANGVAAALLAAGVSRQDKIAHYLYNCPQYPCAPSTRSPAAGTSRRYG